MKMKSVYCYMLAGLMLSASSCSSWLSEDDAPVMSYDYYETEAGVNAAITAAYGFLRWGVGGERFDVFPRLVGECENTKLCRNAIYPRLFIF